MVIRVEEGVASKTRLRHDGRRDPFAMLSPQLLELLRDWYRIARPAMFLFPGRDQIGPMTPRQFSLASGITNAKASPDPFFAAPD